MTLPDDLASADLGVATAAADAARDACEPANLPAVVARLDQADAGQRGLVMSLLEACTSIGDASAGAAVERMLDRVDHDAEVVGIAIGGLAILDPPGWRERMARRVVAGASSVIKAAAREHGGKEYRALLKAAGADGARNRAELEAALSEWVFTADEAHDLSSIDATAAHRLLGWAAKEVGITTAAEWDIAAIYFESENFHSLVEPSQGRAARIRARKR